MFHYGFPCFTMTRPLSFRFLLRADQPDAHGRLVIVLRVIHQRQKADFFTGLRVLPEEWDDAKQTTPKNKPVAEQLKDWQTRVLDARRRLMLSDAPFTLADVKAELSGRVQQQTKLLDYFAERIERIAAQGQSFAPGTVKGYTSTQNHLVDFLQRRKQKSLNLTQVTPSLLSDFDHYLMTKVNAALGRPMHRNGASKHHTRLRAVLSQAEREELIERSPYRSFRLKFDRTNRSFLSAEEVARLHRLDLRDQPSLERVRDLFLFSVYTGLRYKDALSVGPKHVHRDERGRQWLSLVQQKTGDAVRIPLLQPALDLIGRYREQGEVSGRLLPSISNQKLNAYLKVLADLSGISKTLTHHVARHTFATTITLTKGVPIEVVSKLLGHRDLATTQIYAKITADYLGQIADKLDAELTTA